MTMLDEQTVSSSEEKMAEILTQLSALQATIKNQQEEIDQLKDKQEEPITVKEIGKKRTKDKDEGQRTSRRGLLKLAGAAAATIAVSTAGIASQVEPAHAADGSSLLLGSGTLQNNNNTATTTTTITGTSGNTANPLLYVENSGGTSTAIQGNSSSNAGVIGTSSTWYGVYGSSTSQPGVVGNSTNNAGVYGTSTNSTGVSGTSTTGVGISGLGVPIGVQGVGSTNGVWGKSTGGGYGVYGSSITGNGVGVFGDGSVGVNTVGGYFAGGSSAVGGSFTGGLAPIKLVPATSAGAPTTGTHSIGELYTDSTGSIWSCRTAGTPGLWAQLSTARGYYDVRAYGAVGNGVIDDTTYIQNAINAAQDAGGGIVWFPPGVYVITPSATSLLIGGTANGTIPGAITLQGVGWNTNITMPSDTITAPGGAKGSWLYVKASSSYSAVTVLETAPGTIIRDLAIIHFQNTPSSTWTPITYGYAFDIEATDTFMDSIFLLSATLGINIYNPNLDQYGNHYSIGRVSLNKIWGQPLVIGIRIDNAEDVIKINNVHFWPFWSGNQNVYNYMFGTPNTTYSTTNPNPGNAHAIECYRADHPQFSHIFAFNYAIGIMFSSSGDGKDRNKYGTGVVGLATGYTTYFKITDADFDSCATGVLVCNNPTHSTDSRYVADGTSGQILNMIVQNPSNSWDSTSPYYGHILQGYGIDVETNNTRIQASNISLNFLPFNALNLASNSLTTNNGNIIVLENIWVNMWNIAAIIHTGSLSPAISSTNANNRIYLSGGRLVENGVASGGLNPPIISGTIGATTTPPITYGTNTAAVGGIFYID